jgi:hypothetical protein
MTDARPLVRSLLNAFVMAARADLCLSFPRERLDDAWPDVPLLLLPAPLTSTTISLWHVRTSFWNGAEAFFSRGGVLYVSCSADVAIPEMDGILGCRLADRVPGGGPALLRFVRSWGPFGSGDELELPRGDGSLAQRGVVLRASDAETVAVDAEGRAALVVARRGAGTAVTCAYPVETLLAAVPDAHRPDDRSWGLYAGLAGLTLGDERPACTDPDVTLGDLRGPSGGLVAVTNHADRAVAGAVRLPSGVRSAELVAGSGSSPADLDERDVRIELEPFGATVVAWRS